jgi:lysophosphatidic acid phosphatase type 6
MLKTAASLLLLLFAGQSSALPYCGKHPSVSTQRLAVVGAVAELPSNVVSLKSNVYEKDSFEIPAPPPAELGYELSQVFAFLRHGDRNVCEKNTCWSRAAEELNRCRIEDVSLPSNKQGALEFFRRLQTGVEGNQKCAIGQLTTYGFRQHIRNGKILRSAYGSLLSGKFDHREMFVRSTDYSRTISSSQALLVGFFDDFNTLSMHFEHMLDIQVENRTHGIIQPNYHRFPILNQFDSEALEGKSRNPFSKSLRDELVQALRKIEGETNQKLHLDNFTDFFDCLNVNYCNNRTIPVTQDLLFFLNKVTPWKYQSMFANPSVVEYGRYAVGPLLAAARNEMLNKITGSKQARKMYIVMGHDTGPMMPLLSALQIWDGRWPSYASKIVFEMYENRLNGGSFAVRVIYDGQIMLVPGCSSTLCDWNEFDNVLQALLPPSHRSFELTTI